MAELHPSISAVGAHFDDEVEKATQAPRTHKEEGNQANQPARHWLREPPTPSARERAAFPPLDAERQTEEMMHLAQ